MRARRGSTLSPMSREKSWLAATASRTVSRFRARVAGLSVVSPQLLRHHLAQALHSGGQRSTPAVPSGTGAHGGESRRGPPPAPASPGEPLCCSVSKEGQLEIRTHPG